MKARTFITLLSIAAGVGIGPALAEPARMEVTISGVVPTICYVGLAQPVPRYQGQLIDFGTMREFCNQSTGYRVVLHHPAGLADASVLLGGTRVALSPGTETVIVNADGPAITARDLTLYTGASVVGADQLFLQVEPKGALF